MDGRSIIRVIDGDREGESGGRMIPEESREHTDNERTTWALELRVIWLWYIPQ